MDYENRLDFRICFENVDQALEVALATNRKNVIIFMCINNVSRSQLAEALGYQRPSISKNLISNPNMSPEFIDKFCDTFNFSKEDLKLNPIIFYYKCCELKRQQIINDTGKDEGVLYSYDYLNRYGFMKYASKEMIREVKNEIHKGKEETVAVNEPATNSTAENNEPVVEIPVINDEDITEDTLSDYEIARVCSTSKVNFKKKDSFVFVPIFLSVYIVIYSSIFIILGLNKANPDYAYLSLLAFPVVFIMLFLLTRKKLVRNASPYSTFAYERENDYISKPLGYAMITEFVLFTIFFIYSIIALIIVKLEPDEEWMKLLYICILAPSMIAFFLSTSGNMLYKKQLTLRLKLIDKLRGIGFYIQLIVSMLLAICVISNINGLIILLIQLPTMISSLVVYIIHKINLSKYELVEYIFQKKIVHKQ